MQPSFAPLLLFVALLGYGMVLVGGQHVADAWVDEESCVSDPLCDGWNATRPSTQHEWQADADDARDNGERGREWYDSLSTNSAGKTMEQLERDCVMLEYMGLKRSKEYASTTALLAMVHVKVGALSKAQLRFEESIAVRKELGIATGIEYREMVCNLGAVLLMSGEVAKAKRELHKCIQIHEETGDVRSYDFLSSLQNYGAALQSGRDALLVLIRCKALAEELGMQGTETFAAIVHNLERLSDEQ